MSELLCFLMILAGNLFNNVTTFKMLHGLRFITFIPKTDLFVGISQKLQGIYLSYLQWSEGGTHICLTFDSVKQKEKDIQPCESFLSGDS